MFYNYETHECRNYSGRGKRILVKICANAADMEVNIDIYIDFYVDLLNIYHRGNSLSSYKIVLDKEYYIFIGNGVNIKLAADGIDNIIEEVLKENKIDHLKKNAAFGV